MSLVITQVEEAKVKAVVQKTGKTYYRTMRYAKHIIRTNPREPKEKAVHEYFLRKGKIWVKVNEEDFREATSEERVQELHKKLGLELRKRVETEQQN